MNVLDHSLNGALEATARGAFFSFGENLEEQLGGVLIEVDVAEFVDRKGAVAGDDA